MAPDARIVKTKNSWETNFLLIELVIQLAILELKLLDNFCNFSVYFYVDVDLFKLLIKFFSFELFDLIYFCLDDCSERYLEIL